MHTSYFGGKNGFGMYQNIINEIPPHINYYELCLGSGAVMRNKQPGPGRNIGFEIVRSVADKFVCVGSQAVKVECGISWLKRQNNLSKHSDFIYIDPPYQMVTRKSDKKVYWREWCDSDHDELAQLLLSTTAMVMLSTYPGSCYDKILTGWRSKQFKSYTRKGPSTEVIYMNYPAPLRLHEYTFLGSNKTDRQRIKRKIESLQRRLLLLPHLERQAILRDHCRVCSWLTGICAELRQAKN